MTLINQISTYGNSKWSLNSGNSWRHLALHVLSSRLLCKNTIITVYEESVKNSRYFYGFIVHMNDIGETLCLKIMSAFDSFIRTCHVPHGRDSARG